MRWILWAERDELPPEVADELRGDHPPRDRIGRRRTVRSVGLTATASYLPERWMTAAEVGEASGIPEERRSREVRSARQAHRRRRRARQRSCRRGGPPAARGRRHRSRRRSTSSSTTARCGRTTRSGRPRPGSRIGSAAPVRMRSSTTTSRWERPSRSGRRGRCSSPSRSGQTVLLVAACRESYLLDYGNERSRFMFNFGDGAVAGLLDADANRNLVLGSHAITDGSFALQVKVPAGGSVEPPSRRDRIEPPPLPRRRRSVSDEERARRPCRSRTSSGRRAAPSSGRERASKT